MDYQDIIYTKEMASAFVRFPGGMDSNYYDWHSGQLELSVQPNSSETYRFFANLAEQIKRGHPEGTFIEPYYQFSQTIGAEIVLVVNLETSTPANQAEWFNKMKGGGVLPRYIELGNEFWLGMLGDPNVQKKWPDAPTTMRVMKQYTDTLLPYFVVGTKVAVQATANYIVSWPESAQYGAVTSGMLQRSSFFRTAPSAIAVAAGQYVSPLEALSEARGKTDPRARQIREARAIANTRIQSVASAIAYLLLILHQMGLGAVWMTGPMQAKAEIEKIIGVPPEMDLVAFIPVGYPGETPPLRVRKPVKDVCQVIR